MAEEHDTPSSPFAQFLRSPMFTIVIRVPPSDESNHTAAAAQPSTTGSGSSDSNATSPGPPTAAAPPAAAANPAPAGCGAPPTSSDPAPPTTTISYTMHKALLASLSPELAPLIDNTMRQGSTTIHLADVHPDTFEKFAVWAYKDGYPACGLLAHARLFVFGERFNIVGLRRLAREGIEAALKAPAEESGTWWGEVGDSWATVFEGVPMGSLNRGKAADAPEKEADDVELVLRLLAKYSLANIKPLRREERFRELVAGNGDFALALVDEMEAAAAIASLNEVEFHRKLSKQKWRCGHCAQEFNVGPMMDTDGLYRPYLFRRSCRNCNYKTGLTLAP